jgi:rhodanese-related sulfurtransferase
MQPVQIPVVTLEEFDADLSTAVLLDVREDYEWAAGHIQGALHIPMNSVPAHLTADPDVVPRDQPFVVICKVGGRSAQVTAWLRARGYDARNFDGGMLTWAVAHRPMISEDGSAPEVA